jgi:DNA-binding transcriptional MerR regulator
MARPGDQADRFWTVGELAKELGVTPRTVRFYEDRGLVLPRRAGTTRVYARRDRARLILILRGKQLGFSLRDIKEFLDLYDADPAHAEQLRLLLGKVRSRLALLDEQRAALDETLVELRRIEAQAASALDALTETAAA